MTIFCDESGGIGRGVMTLAGVMIDAEAADSVLASFRARTGWIGELKGSRIDMQERALLFEALAETNARAAIAIAISALRAEPGEPRGVHDRLTYAALLDRAVSALLPMSGGCVQVLIDDGRYDGLALSAICADIARLIGPCGSASLELSHRAAGLQIADVIANSFFNRALVSPRQSAMAALVAPWLANGRFGMTVLAPDDQPSAPSTISSSTKITNTNIDANSR